MSLSLQPFTVSVQEEALTGLQNSLRNSRLARPTHAGEIGEGVRNDWIVSAKRYWEESFDWRAQEKRINELNHFTTVLPQSDGSSFKFHLIHEPSSNKKAIPLLLLHGWPGSFLEFVDLTKILRKSGRYSIVVPSLPGFGFSDAPPLKKKTGVVETSDLLHELMLGLGYANYSIQGGDLGATLARVMACRYPLAVDFVHLNMMPVAPPKSFLHASFPSIMRNSVLSAVGTSLQAIVSPFLSPLTFNTTADERLGIKKAAEFTRSGAAYSIEHATRPSTLSYTVGASPVALLAWVGEKFLEWSDEDPRMDEILTSLTLYWVTSTFESSIYMYKDVMGFSDFKLGSYYITQPTAFTSFQTEIKPLPRSWAAQSANLVFYRYHTKGGHFAAMEKPEVLAKDIEDFFGQVAGKRESKL